MEERGGENLKRLPVGVAEKLRTIFPNFEESELLESDWEMWRLVQDGSASKEEYEAYRSGLLRELGREAKTEKSPRLQFCDFLGDRMQELLDEKRRKKQ